MSPVIQNLQLLVYLTDTVIYLWNDSWRVIPALLGLAKFGNNLAPCEEGNCRSEGQWEKGSSFSLEILLNYFLTVWMHTLKPQPEEQSTEETKPQRPLQQIQYWKARLLCSNYQGAGRTTPGYCTGFLTSLPTNLFSTQQPEILFIF